MAYPTTYDTETELSSVNSILAAIGQAPVSRLYTSTNSNPSFINPEVAFAYGLLMECNVDVQAEGWNFNTEYNYPLPANSKGKFPIPKNVLMYDVTDGQVWRTTDVIRKQGFLYNKVTHTDVWEEDELCLDIVWKWEYEDLPPVFKRYITLRASTRAAVQMVTNRELAQLLKEQEGIARASCLEYECNQGDPTFLGLGQGSVYSSYQPFKALNRQ